MITATPTAPPTPISTLPRASWSSRRRRRPLNRRDILAATLFMLPTVILIVVLRVVPAVSAVSDSTKSGLPGSLNPPQFVGFDVFAHMFVSESFWQSVRQTLIFNIVVNPLQIFLALVLAVLLTRGLPGSGLWRTLIFLPAAVPVAGSTIVWGLALRPDGPVNGVLGLFHIPAQPFLTSPDQVLGSLLLIVSWIGIGYWMMFLIAGLNDIPTVYYEAARVDGAGPLRTFFSVTIPMLRRPLLLVLVADTVANFVLFAPVQILTRGGPEKASNLLMYDIFHRSYELQDPYTASAQLVVLLLLMIVIVLIQFRLLGSSEDD
jgi:ABC-type sugar transport system permease subunit